MEVERTSPIPQTHLPPVSRPPTRLGIKVYQEPLVFRVRCKLTLPEEPRMTYSHRKGLQRKSGTLHGQGLADGAPHNILERLMNKLQSQ